MRFLQQHLYYLDKNWKVRWYAKNYNLVIDYIKKTFYEFTSHFYNYRWDADIQLTRKSDIIEYKKMLEKKWFENITSTYLHH